MKNVWWLFLALLRGSFRDCLLPVLLFPVHREAQLASHLPVQGKQQELLVTNGVKWHWGEESAFKKIFRNGVDKHSSERIYMSCAALDQGNGLRVCSPCLLWTPRHVLWQFAIGVPPHPFCDRFGDRGVTLSLVLSPFSKISEGLTC